MYARLTKYRSRDNPVTIVRKVANSHSFFAADGQIDGFSEVQAWLNLLANAFLLVSDRVDYYHMPNSVVLTRR